MRFRCQRDDLIGSHSLGQRVLAPLRTGLEIGAGVARALAAPPAHVSPQAGAPSIHAPGQWVRVVDADRLRAALGEDGGALNGVAGEPALWKTCGKTYRVQGSVQQLIADDGRRRPASGTVLLEGATCHSGGESGCGLGCPLMYRDEWLEPLAQPPADHDDAAPARWACVLPLERIRASLDRRGQRDGITFLPEMASLAGRRLQVLRQVTRVFELGRWSSPRATVYQLDDASCTGTSLGGRGPCDRACSLLWHADWLALEAPARVPTPRHPDAYTAVFRDLLLPSWEQLRGRSTVSHWRELDRTQWCSLDELRAMQVVSLRRLLTHAVEQVPAYRRRIQEAGLDPRRVRDPEELQALAPVNRAEMQADRAAFTARAEEAAAFVKSTSGTTGAPLRFLYSQDSDHWRQATKLRGYSWTGYVPGMRTLHYWGPPAVPPVGANALKVAADRAVRREHYLDCARQSEGDLIAAVDTLRRLRPEILVGFSQATAELARFIMRRRLRDWPAMRVVCGAERLFPDDRLIMEQALSEPGGVFETYGCREFMLLAGECEGHEGMHQSMENLIVEVVDQDGQLVPPGTVGQVAITDLHNLAMPFIRYLTGDLATASAPGRCACGRELLRLASVEGRQADLLRGPDGRGIPGMVFNSVLAGLGEQVLQFQAIQRRDLHIDLRIVPGPSFEDALADRLRQRLAPYLASLPLEIQVVSSIPTLPSGKRRHVLVER